MADIVFTVTHDFDQPAETVWAALIDWEANGDWIPATRVEVDAGDPTAVGATFTGYTGAGPLTLVDRMEIAEIEWREADETGTCVVNKLGPVLDGQAGFTVSPKGIGSQVEWFEDVSISFLPGFLSPIINRLSAHGFGLGMKKLGKQLAKQAVA